MGGASGTYIWGEESCIQDFCMKERDNLENGRIILIWTLKIGW
jgi:hypothetical protein